MKALLLVDLQYDFMPGGSLAVTDGDETVAFANRLIPHFELVAATQDWHPADHKSFASQHAGKDTGDVIELDGLQQILWPDHCIQSSHGAEFHADLQIEAIDHVVQKGTNPQIDSYSGFFDNGHRQETDLANTLKERGVSSIAILGLATDYCVKFTVLDALQLGFQTTLVSDGCRGVELQAGDTQRAIDEMKQAGAQVVTSNKIIRPV